MAVFKVMLRRMFRPLTALALVFLILTTACSTAPQTSRWDAAQTAPPPTATADVLAGEQFNPFFPPDGNGYERVYVQEKSGFAEAKLKQDGKDLAMLSVSDTAANPAAVEKYRSSSRAIAGYPAVDIGSQATALLVGDRLQVKVQSRDDSFTPSDREAWLTKFDLDGLNSLVAP